MSVKNEKLSLAIFASSKPEHKTEKSPNSAEILRFITKHIVTAKDIRYDMR